MEATKTKVEPAQFLWHELVTSDVDASVDFYSHVVGWTTQAFDFEGSDGPPYTMWVAGEVPVGGIWKIEPETMGDIPPHWTSYVHTDDIEATVRRVEELGGSVFRDPMEVPKVGWMAGLSDPQGATIWLLQPAGSEPMPEPPKEGSFTWNELATTDCRAAATFYEKLFAWQKVEEMDMGEDGPYLLYGKGETMYAGIFDKPEQMPGPPHWLYYVYVDDLEAALERVKERGGQVLNGPMDIPGDDHIAQCMDPQGVAFALHATKG